MKIKVTSGRWQVTRRVRAENLITHHSPHITAFTMMEIAISLAVIGIALVGIIAILPRGMQTQRENREQTLINQDATVFMENIRNGARGRFETDLTNYVYAITNYQTFYSPTPGTPTVFGYDNSYLTNNERIIGLLSAPEYTDNFGNPIYDISGGNYYSNHIVAYVHSISGSAIEKPPQDNTLLLNSSFGYEILCVNAPLAADTNALNSAYGKKIWPPTCANCA